MNKFTLFTLMMEIIAILLMITGVLVGFKKKITPAQKKKQKNTTAIKNPEKISKVVGYSLIIIGIMTTFMPAAIRFFGRNIPFFTYVTIIFLLIANIFRKAAQYQK